jgi:putative transposase
VKAAVMQAYRFALDPTPAQRRALASHCGAARFAYNWGLAFVKARLDARATDPGLTVPWTLPALRREWNQAKAEVAPWWAENSKEAYSSGLDALARALTNFSDSKQGRRQGQRVGFPRYKKKGRARDACRFTTGTIRVQPDRHHITLPRLGRIKTHESTRKLARRLEHGTARILSATISRQAQRWFVAFTVEVDRHLPPTNGQSSIVGVDVGVRHLAVIAGPDHAPEFVDNPRPLQAQQRALARAQRTLARRQPGSRGREQARQQISRLHARVVNLRRDYLHKLTTRLAHQHHTVVVEDLQMAGMLRNRHLARAIADAALAELRRMLIYKTRWYGATLVVADRWYPSSKTCSDCGLVKIKLGLAERTFHCQGCGLVIDRDENAARNLAMLAVAASGAETQNARGPDLSPGLSGQTGTKREASTGAQPDKPGTVPPQGGTT